MHSATRVLLTLASVLGAGLDNKGIPEPKHDAVCLRCGKTTRAKGCSLAAHLIASGWKNGVCPNCQK